MPKKKVEKPWVTIELNEGLTCDFLQGGNVDVFFVDYDECRENPEYVREKIEELKHRSIPKEQRDRIMEELKSYQIKQEMPFVGAYLAENCIQSEDAPPDDLDLE